MCEAAYGVIAPYWHWMVLVGTVVLVFQVGDADTVGTCSNHDCGESDESVLVNALSV